MDETALTSPGAPLLMALRSAPPALSRAGEIAELDALSARPLTFMDRIGEILERRTAGTPVMIAVDVCSGPTSSAVRPCPRCPPGRPDLRWSGCSPAGTRTARCSAT
ncbi:hypothetical protein ACFV2H_03570 [Streptomyces sp. NPDC059629]|uniref:hypothetical protein n=1 Tax=Streptomyces sp. NPDC059629 TaxID=3346889 RepID=UPI0036837971